MNVHILATSKEYLRFPFTPDVNPLTLSAGQVAFVAGNFTPLPQTPTWINAVIVTTGEAHLRVIHAPTGGDVALTPGAWTWYARFTDTPELPVEMGDNLIIVR